MNPLEALLAKNFHVPLVGNEISRLAVNHIAARTPPRPRLYSLWSHVAKPATGEGPVSDYTSWPSLTDRKYSGRHLPPADPVQVAALPDINQVTALFKRQGPMVPGRSSILFMFFAQWFTDSVLRVDTTDRRRNTSNHEVDLCQIYGLDEATTRILRSGAGGRLRCQDIGGESFLDYLHHQDPDSQWHIKPEYENLPYTKNLDVIFKDFGDDRRHKAYATGLERGNSTIGYVAISTLFMREHNRICGELAKAEPAWDDERLFQTARMINIVLLLKVIIEDYINHIVGAKIFRFDTGFAERQDWYRTNWIAIEFDLLYRWHSLVPDAIVVDGATLSSEEFRNNNALVESVGLAGLFGQLSTQAAGRIGLRNSPSFLMPAERAALDMSRNFRLAPYNAYRERFGLAPLGDLRALAGDDADTLQALQAVYTDINEVEFLVGIFAEDRNAPSLFGDLLNTMVAYDAFTQIFTNPLLSRNVYGAGTLTSYGLSLIDATSSVADIAGRNMAGPVTASLGV